MAEPTRAERRAEGRRARQQVVGTARRNAERSIVEHLLSIELAPASSVALYVSDDGEPDLAAAACALRARGHEVALPVPDERVDDATMQFRAWRRDDVLVPGRFDIPCPPERHATVPDVVVVPLVRFDPFGARLGRGAGFYDRWLAGDGRHARTIGVGFEAQRSSRLETHDHDVPLDIVVTELGIRFVLPMGSP